VAPAGHGSHTRAVFPETGSFERFTDPARRVVRRAFQEAGYERPIGTGHLYRALLRDPDVAELVEKLRDFPNGVPPLTGP
jgi:hypothetical protein